MRVCTKKKHVSHAKSWISMLNSAGIRQKTASVPAYNNLYAYASNNPIRYTDPDGRTSGVPEEVKKIMRQRLYKKLDLNNLIYWTKSNPEFAKYVKSHMQIVINRSKYDNQRNGNYYQSTLELKLNGKVYFSCKVQSTADYLEFVAEGKGDTLNVPISFDAELLTSSKSFKRPIRLISAYLIHPNAFTGKGQTTQWQAPYSGGCQVVPLEDFNKLISLLDKLGFVPGDFPKENETFQGDTIKVIIYPSYKNWSIIEKESMEN